MKRSTEKSPHVYAALLRGINVGGKNMLPMSELAKFFIEHGCASATTYIQSGNVIFVASPECAARIGERVSERIHKRFGFRSPVIVRTASELAPIVESNPFPDAADAGTLHVAFLADAPDSRKIASLDPNRSPGDSFKVRGREIYLRLTNGVGKTKLTNGYLDRTLGTISTLRNWRTVLKLLQMATAARE